MCTVPASSIDPVHAPTANVRDAKLALRLRLLSERDRLSPETRSAASSAIVAAIAARDDFRRARTLLLTLPFGSEWDMRPLLVQALSQGKAVALPRVDQERRMLAICRVVDLRLDVTAGYRTILEPGAHCQIVEPARIDWALVPGVAFDVAGRRLGYGGGYYDRLLPTLRTDARRIAGAFDLQIVDHVPAAPHDLTVDAVVTPSRTLIPA
ncbi:MAG: 5-formyltetrahydrofolate cyclo-ligase [Betaproteobacteria bacterium]|nr:MAG: 5-formyltetrahydrofolate cyclo-ligase [Betaproteobacteria bacterium]